jgi:aspartate-semialdehyde dehydrogenase
MNFDDENVPPENLPETLIRDRTDSSMHFRKKIPVGILGATGCVGQKFVQLLSKHPWFELVALTGSEKSQGKSYKEACNWMQSTILPAEIGKLQVLPTEPNIPCKIVFSALSSDVAGEIEKKFASKGYAVISTASAHRTDPDVPLMIPEVNADHLQLVKKQKFPQGGMIITKPNCAVIGLVLALRPLALEFGIEKVHVVTMQSSSGAGIPGVPSLALLDNIIPYIAGEEEKMETEPLKILGQINGDHIDPYKMTISASCKRVPVTEGHFEAVSVKLKDKATDADVKRAWQEFYPPIQELKLPSSPVKILYYFEEKDSPQPKLHRDLEKGMAVSIGRLRACPLFDYKFDILSHNMIRGAAGGAVLIAELLVKNGFVYW